MSCLKIRWYIKRLETIGEKGPVVMGIVPIREHSLNSPRPMYGTNGDSFRVAAKLEAPGQ